MFTGFSLIFAGCGDAGWAVAWGQWGVAGVACASSRSVRRSSGRRFVFGRPHRPTGRRFVAGRWANSGPWGWAPFHRLFFRRFFGWFFFLRGRRRSFFFGRRGRSLFFGWFRFLRRRFRRRFRCRFFLYFRLLFDNRGGLFQIFSGRLAPGSRSFWFSRWLRFLFSFSAILAGFFFGWFASESAFTSGSRWSSWRRELFRC